MRRVVDALGDRVTLHRGDHQVYARCPVPGHDDQNPSLSVTWKLARDGGGRTFVRCQRSCSAAEVVAALGLVMADLYDTPPARPSGERAGYAAAPRPARPKRAKTTPAGGRGAGPRPAPTAVHSYPDADGVRVYDVLRYPPTEDRPQKYACRSYDRAGQRVVAWKAPAADRRVLYGLPSVLAAAAAGDRVYVCEGEKDADALTAAGRVATCNPFGACDTPGRAAEKWLPQYTATLRGAHVVIVPDRDRAGYAHALHVATELDQVAASVTIAEPAAGNDAADHLFEGHGVDDLVLVSLAELRTRAAAAGDDSVVDQLAPAAAPAEPGAPAAPGQTIDLAGERHRRRGSDDGGAGGSDGGSGGSGDGEPEWRHVVVRDRFEATEDGLFKLKLDPEAELVTHTELLPVKVTLARRIREDQGDGEDPEVTHVDLVAERHGESVELRKVKRETYEKCAWVLNLPWAAPFNDSPGGRSMLRKAIESTSGGTSVVTMYRRYGWQEIDGRQVYVHAAGALDANGPVPEIRVNPAPELARLTLAPAPATTTELRDAVEASTMALDVLPARLMAPLLGAAYRACLGYSPVTVNPVGRKASGKTALAALVMQHYDPTSRYNNLPGSGAGENAGTPGGIEELRFLASDMLQLLDDLAPDRGPERASARLSELARSQFNRTGRVRMRRDGGLRPTHCPGGTQLITGEESTTVESGDSRIVSLRVHPGDVDKQHVLPTLDERGDPQRRAQLTAAMIVHYAPHMPMTDWLRPTVAALRNELVDPTATGTMADQDLRHSESVADLAAGWRAMLDMATARGALTETEAADLWARAWAGLTECKRHLMAGSATRTPADRVRELLHALLQRGDIALTAKNGSTPAYPSRCGWQQTPAGDWWTNAPSVGWTDGERVWLHPGAVYPMMDRQATAEREPLSLTRDGLSQALAGCDVTRTRQSKGITRYTVPVRLGPENTPTDVWEFRASWLWPEDTGGDDDDDDPGSDDGDDPDAPTPPAPTALTGGTNAGECGGTSPHIPAVQSTDSANRSPGGTEAPEVRATEDASPRVPPPASPDVPDRAAESLTEPQPPSSAGDTPPDPQPAGSGPQRPPERRSRRPGTPAAELPTYAGLGVVCEADKAWLACPGEELAELVTPSPVSVETLLSWVDELALGHVDGRGRYRGARRAFGQIWVQPSLRKALGWPSTLTEREDGKESATARKVRESIEAVGWTIRTARATGNRVGAWTAIYREGRPAYHLVVPDWLYEPSALEEQDPDAAALAGRLARYAEVTGLAYQWSPAVSGVRLMTTTRPALLSRERPALPRPARAGDVREGDLVWQRGPEPDERAMQWVDAWDFNGLYLGAATSLPLAWGTYEHVQDPAVDLKRPGLWLVTLPEWTEPRLPDPWQSCRRGGKRVWVTTPSLKLADRLDMLDQVRVHEAWLATAGLNPRTGRRESGVFRLDAWATELRDARLAVAGDDPAVEAAVKGSYAGGIGRLDYTAWRGSDPPEQPLWRPDIRAAIVAQGRFAVLNRVLTAADAGRYPLVITTDAVVYPSNAPLTAAALPAGFRLGTGLGEVKHLGRLPMSAVADQLGADDRAAAGSVMETIKAGEQLVVNGA